MDNTNCSPEKPQKKFKVNSKVEVHQCQITPYVIVEPKCTSWRQSWRTPQLKANHNKQNGICHNAYWQSFLENLLWSDERFWRGSSALCSQTQKGSIPRKETVPIVKHGGGSLCSSALFLHLTPGVLNKCRVQGNAKTTKTFCREMCCLVSESSHRSWVFQQGND